LREASSQTKVAYLELTVGIDQKVPWFQVSVQDIGGVDVFQPAKDLIDERLKVGVGQGLSGSDDGGQIALHKF
jgi:hypothetical protein